ncbi:hypothetical protein D030_3806 [Vibrio parahaemolyticus AQ3810]|nr:hypothetical protein D030_3806 [Vibrio parahaemolyticus AQ3810]
MIRYLTVLIDIECIYFSNYTRLTVFINVKLVTIDVSFTLGIQTKVVIISANKFRNIISARNINHDVLLGAIGRRESDGILHLLPLVQLLNLALVQRIRPLSIHQYQLTVSARSRSVAEHWLIAIINIRDSNGTCCGRDITEIAFGHRTRKRARHNGRVFGARNINHDVLLGAIGRRESDGILHLLPLVQLLNLALVQRIRPLSIHQYQLTVSARSRSVAELWLIAIINISNSNGACCGHNITEVAFGHRPRKRARHDWSVFGARNRDHNFMLSAIYR